MPTLGKVYVTLAGGAFGPAGESTPLEAATPAVMFLPPAGANAAGL